MKVKEYLQEIKPEQFHIFDSHQEGMDERGVSHKDQDYKIYSYNIHKNNKPRPGDAFLYRRPGKSSKSRKFYIYGGGVIESISVPDREGNVEAVIEMPFKLKEPLNQGDAYLESFEWSIKKKLPGSWSHFWNQYGMNIIKESDFFGLVGNMECTVPGNHNMLPAYPAESAEEDYTVINELDATGFKVNITDSGKRTSGASNNISHKITGTHIDYDALQNSKSTLGKAGELLVVELLREQYEGTGARIEHTSVLKGDGYGYDIMVRELDGSEIYIEVKTTKASFVDGFYITPKELHVARQCETKSLPAKKYQVYRVYNFDAQKKTASIKVYEEPFNDESFRFVPVSWKVYER